MEMTRDQELVQQLQRRLPTWNPNGRCKFDNRKSCLFDKRGQLIRLHICNLGISEIPSELGQFSALQELHLYDNQLSTLPAELGNLSALQELDLSRNQLSTLPAELGNLSALQKLHLSYNQFSTLPAELGNLSALQKLDLNGNQFSTLPAEIGQLPNLQELSLVDNQLSTLPAEIGQLPNLQELYLGYNQFSILPAVIGQLPNLRSLGLSHNQLRTLPAEIGQIPNLRSLHLDGNQFSILPAVIGQLPNLRFLWLGTNQLSTLPAEIGQLAALESLNLGTNQLSILPAVIGQLPNLDWLYLSHNQLRTLPAVIGQLPKLEKLYLEYNQLSSLPVEISQLPKLQELKLDGNPLRIPPPEIIAQGIPAIFAYLRMLQQAAVERFESKVILVGEGGMGKSSLLRALRQQPFVEGLPPTHGIDVSAMRTPHPSRAGTEITLYTWDFGGQEIYQATHQFFLTHHSVYLLVWNARLGVDACRLPFWLDTITAHAPDAKVLLVATHRDLWQMSAINLVAYQQRYPQIVGLCSISNKTGEGLEALKEQVAAAAAETPFVGQQWPRTWVEAEQALLARPEDHLDQAAFLMTCLQQKIEDETERETFGRYLHDLGKILYFHDDPVLRTLVVLKPNWITKAISRVLTDPQVQQASGVLEYRELPRIWATDEQGRPYPRALYPIFVRMMERFELCYQLEPERPGQPVSQSLIPQLLQEQPPAALPPIPRVPEVEQMLLEMRYTLSFVPAGLMSWLLVRTHRYSQRQHWREGARLAYAGQQAQVALDSQQREITITVWGPFPYTFLLILKHTLDDLLQTFHGLRVQRTIPCRCARQPQAPHYHNYEDLERRLARRESEIICSEGERLPLATLLYGLHASTVPQVEATVQQTQQAITRQLAPNQQAPQQMPAEELRRMLVRLHQGQEYLYRFQLHLERQKLRNPCPGLFVLERATRTPLNPHDWVSRAYRLHLLCQHPQGPHLVKGEPGYEVRQGEDWWQVMSPWLRRLIKLLEVGVPLGKALNEGFKLVDIERFGPEIEVFNEILADLPEIEASDALSQARLDAQEQTPQHLEGAALEALHTLLQGHPRPWQGLTQVIADDGTLLWMCDSHRKALEAQPITV